MTLNEARAMSASVAGRTLSTAQITQFLLDLEQIIGARPQQFVGPKLKLRWIETEGTFTVKPRPFAGPDGGLAWRVGYSYHVDDTMQRREKTIFSDEIMDPKIRAALPYFYNLGVAGDAWVTEPKPVIASWHALIENLGGFLAELPALLAVVPQSWWGATSVDITDQTSGSLKVHATKDGLQVRLRTTTDGEHREELFVTDAVGSLEAGPLLAREYARTYARGTYVETVKLDIDTHSEIFQQYIPMPGLGDENRLDTDVDPNYSDVRKELGELVRWHGVDGDFPPSEPPALDLGTQEPYLTGSPAALRHAEVAGVVASSDETKPRWKFWAK